MWEIKSLKVNTFKVKLCRRYATFAVREKRSVYKYNLLEIYQLFDLQIK